MATANTANIVALVVRPVFEVLSITIKKAQGHWAVQWKTTGDQTIEN